MSPRASARAAPTRYSPIGLLALAFQTRRGAGRTQAGTRSRASAKTAPAASAPRGALTERSTTSGLRRAPRPFVEVVDMIAHVAAVATETRARSVGPHRLQPASAEAEVEGRLLGRTDGAPPPSACRPVDCIIVHCAPRRRPGPRATGLGRQLCPLLRSGQRPEKRKSATRAPAARAERRPARNSRDPAQH